MHLTSSSNQLREFGARAKSFLFGSDSRKGVSISVMAHMAVVAGIAATFVDWRLPEPPPEIEDRPIITFNLPGPETDSEENSEIPELAPPTAVEEATGPVSDAPVEEVAFNEGGSGDESRVWTPDPPSEGTPEGQTVKVDGVERDRASSPAFELIDMPENGTEPTLVSYDVGKFDGARAMEEAIRLNGEGRMQMKVVIDEQGIPIGCSTTETSGSNVLDELGCGLVMTYRYDPGKDAEERPVQSMAYEVLEWSRGGKFEREDEESRAKRLAEETLSGDLSDATNQ